MFGATGLCIKIQLQTDRPLHRYEIEIPAHYLNPSDNSSQRVLHTEHEIPDSYKIDDDYAAYFDSIKDSEYYEDDLDDDSTPVENLYKLFESLLLFVNPNIFISSYGENTFESQIAHVLQNPGQHDHQVQDDQVSLAGQKTINSEVFPGIDLKSGDLVINSQTVA